MSEAISTQDKGKQAELLVFAELVGRGVDVYTPIVDKGIDGVIRRKDGTYAEVQIKATQAENQAGYFNVPDFDDRCSEHFYVVCVDLNEYDWKDGEPVPDRNKSQDPADRLIQNAWILTSKEFKDYETAGHRLAMYEASKNHDNQKRYDLLREAYRAWERLT